MVSGGAGGVVPQQRLTDGAEAGQTGWEGSMWGGEGCGTLGLKNVGAEKGAATGSQAHHQWRR
jgi:hypothetical protein